MEKQVHEREKQECASNTELQGRVQDRAVSVAAEHETAMAELQGRMWAMEEQVTKQETEMWWLAKEVLEVRAEALTAAHDTTEDNRVETAAPDGPKDFESVISAVQHSKTAERRRRALANKA